MQETNKTKNPHPHKELMKLWIEDRDIKIQFKNREGTWTDLRKQPSWVPDIEYRVKPADPVAKYKFAYGLGNSVAITTDYYLSVDDLRERNPFMVSNWAEPIQNTKIMVQP